MRTSTRNFVAIGTAAASLAVGIVGARALQDDDTATTTAVGSFDPPVLVSGDPDTSDDQEYPLLRPVATGDDPKIVEQLVEAPPAITPETMGPEVGRPGETPVIGVATGAPVDLGTATPIDGEAVLRDFLIYFDGAFGGLFPIPELAFDTCAGSDPGMLPPPRCPEGYAGTLHDEHLMPTPFMFASPGHYLAATEGFPTTCPAGTPAAASGQEALTIFSVTPLSSLQVQWRPYGSSAPWQSLTVDEPTLAAQRETWLTRIDEEAFDRATWGLIPRCIVITRDPNTAYEGLLTAVDEFGREVTANRTFTLFDATPEGRPPTTARIIGNQPKAQVEAWTTPEGSVTFKYVLATPTNPDPENCLGAADIDPALVHYADGSRPIPVGVFDTRYSRRAITTIDLPPGAVAVVCATIYDSNNVLRPLGTDVLRLQARTAQRPVITLEGFRLNDGVRVPVEDLVALIQNPGATTLLEDGCSNIWRNDFELTGGGSIVQAPLWECEYAPLPVDVSGYVKVPVTLIRDIDAPAEDQKQTWGIQIQLDDCDPGCPYRPAQYYEIPVPSASLVLCGHSFWESDDGCPQPTDGVAIVKVTYPIIEGAPGRLGTATLISSVERPDGYPSDGAPLIQVVDRTGATGPDWRNLIATFDVVADRPITISRIDMRDATGDAGPGCQTREVAVGGAAATEFEIDVTQCIGTVMAMTVHYTDAAGVAYEQFLSYTYSEVLVSPLVETKVEFLGGDDVPNFGWMYEFLLTLDGQSAGYYDWFSWDGPRGAAGSSCMDLDETTATSHGTPRIVVYGSQLALNIRMNITTGGRTNCSGSGADGLGPIEFGGWFTIEQLMSGEPMVLITPPDARLQMRITVTPVAPWRLSP